jgi:hypothetical protein
MILNKVKMDTKLGKLSKNLKNQYSKGRCWIIQHHQIDKDLMIKSKYNH